MRANEIIRILREAPFTGLRIYISDGLSYEVYHPDMMLVTERKVYIALPPSREDAAPGGAVHCDPLHITRIEPLNGRKRSAKGKQRKVE